MRKVLVIFCFLLPVSVVSQDFTGSASVGKISKDGFYKVAITPELTQWLEPGAQNARLMNEQGEEVPFLVEESQSFNIETFQPYEIVDRKIREGCCSSIIVKTGGKVSVTNLVLKIRNAEIEKNASLLGSDDLKQWFALKANFKLNYISNQAESSQVRIVDFPLSDYIYYQIQINDSTSPPLNILDVGYLSGLSNASSLELIPGTSLILQQRMQTKQTYAYVRLPGKRWLDRIKITASGPPYFLREASLFRVDSTKGKNGQAKAYQVFVKKFKISSENATEIDVPGEIGKDYVIVIDNDDNPPLDVKAVELFQLNRWMNAYLLRGISYTLKWGPNLRTPVYDLSHFKDKIPNDIQTIAPGRVVVYDRKQSITVQPSIFNSPWFMWSAIVLVIGLLAWMSLNMIKDTKRVNTPNEN